MNELMGPARPDLHAYLRARDSGFAHKLLGPANGRLLDVGSGEGEDFALLERQGWSVVGVDPGQRVHDPHFVLGVGERLPFQGGSFSAATCILVLPHVSFPDATVREVCRVLRPGGRAVFVVFSWSPLNFRIAVTGHWLSSDSRRFSTRLYGARGLRQVLSAAGFREVRFWRSDYLPWMTGLISAALRERLFRVLDRSDRGLADGPLAFLARKIIAVGVKG